MIDTAYLKQIFTDKLGKTGSFDDAFTKATWVAYNQGLSDAKEFYELEKKEQIETKQS